MHSNDLVNCFWEFYKKPRYGEVYNIGGGRYSNCSIIEALNLVENISGIKIKRKIISHLKIKVPTYSKKELPNDLKSIPITTPGSRFIK